jgi:hypothetical protein
MGGLERAPKPPGARSAPGNPWRSSIVRAVGGLERAPQAPRRSERPGKPVALLNRALGAGAPNAPWDCRGEVD